MEEKQKKFNFIDREVNGFRRVKLNQKWNIIDANGNILSNKWYKNVWSFHDGFAKVQREDKKWNFIDKEGKFLSKKWFKWVDRFKKKITAVQREDEMWNFIGKDGKLLSKEWYREVWYFKDGFARVQRENGKECLINTQRQLCDLKTKEVIKEKE